MNKCSDCDHAYKFKENIFCLEDDKTVNAYGCERNLEDIDNGEYDEDEEIQEGEEPRHYPDDPMDLAKDKFLDEYMKGEH